jgi:phosphoribosylformimino-5-aminoimidazole carboxamide ribotide isomerase
VVASGGVASLDDVRACRAAGLAGVIVGKALYEGRVDLAEAVAIARGERV